MELQILKYLMYIPGDPLDLTGFMQKIDELASFLKMHFNGLESLKGTRHPQRVPYPWRFVCSGAWEKESRFISKL